MGKDTVPGVGKIGAEDTQPADEHRHLGCGQGQELSPVDQKFLRRHGVLLLLIVSEAVRGRLEDGERFLVGLFLGCIRASRCEGDAHLVPGVTGRNFDARPPGQDDQIGQGDPLAVRPGSC